MPLFVFHGIALFMASKEVAASSSTFCILLSIFSGCFFSSLSRSLFSWWTMQKKMAENQLRIKKTKHAHRTLKWMHQWQERKKSKSWSQLVISGNGQKNTRMKNTLNSHFNGKRKPFRSHSASFFSCWFIVQFYCDQLKTVNKWTELDLLSM